MSGGGGPGGGLTAAAVVGALEQEGVTHTAGLPDSALAPLLDRLAAHDRIRYVPVTREGEAFAVASGVWLGGGTPLVAIQSTGLFEAGDALRGTAQRMGVPLVVLVSYRGWRSLDASARGSTRTEPPAGDLVRADVDSAALWLEPTLRGWGVPFRYVGEEADGSVDPTRDLQHIRDAFVDARRDRRPTALLLTRKLT